MARIRTSVLGVLLVLVTGCASADDPEERDDEMNQGEARDHLVEVVREVLAAAAPEETDGLSDVTDVPCGGPGGNEWSRVRYSLESVDGITVDDDAAALEAARARIEGRGWQATPRGDGVDFSAGGVTGTVWSRGGTVLVSAESDCVDNIER